MFFFLHLKIQFLEGTEVTGGKSPAHLKGGKGEVRAGGCGVISHLAGEGGVLEVEGDVGGGGGGVVVSILQPGSLILQCGSVRQPERTSLASVRGEH